MNPFDPAFIDTFFNGRPAPRAAAPPVKTKVQISVHELIARGSSVVRVGDKYYKISAKQVEFTKA